MGTGWFGGLYRISEWITRLAYLNILWIAFSLLGGVVLGVFPATAATFAVTRKWILEDTEAPIFKVFWQTYRSEFKQSNILGFILLLIGFFLYFDLRFAQAQDDLFYYFQYSFMGLLLFYVIMTLYIFPIFSHYEMRALQYIKYALIHAIAKPLQSLLMIIGALGIAYFMMFIPGLIPFYSISLMSTYLMWGASLSFPKTTEELEQK